LVPDQREDAAEVVFMWPVQDDTTLVVDLQNKTIVSLEGGAENVSGLERAAFTGRRLHVKPLSTCQQYERPERAVETARDSAAGSRYIATRILISALTVVIAIQSVVLAAVLLRHGSNADREAVLSEQPGPRILGPTPSRSPSQVTSLTSSVDPAVSAGNTTESAKPVTSDSREPVRSAEVGTAGKEGRLIARIELAGATVSVDGQQPGTSPMTVENVASSSHRIEIRKDGEAIGEQASVSVGSPPSVAPPYHPSGWLEVRGPIDVQVLEDGHPLGPSAEGLVALTSGEHQIELRNDAVGYRTTSDVSIADGQVTTLRLELPEGVVHVNALPWAEVLIDGRYVGITPLGNLHVTLGRHEIQFHHPSLGDAVRVVVVTAGSPAHVSVNLR
jgi:hypothetical protein